MKTSQIQMEYGFSSSTIADWRQFINETILDFVEFDSATLGEKIYFEIFRALIELHLCARKE